MEFEKIKEIIARVMNVDPADISEDMSFTDDLGADSLDIFQIIMEIEEQFEIEINDEDAQSIVTVSDAARQVGIKRGGTDAG